MSFRPAPQPARPTPADRQDLLFTGGPRLGWVFRDRRELAVPYPEPGPSQNDFRAHATARAADADRALARAWRWAGWILPLMDPCPFNIGISCGPSGLVVIDLDIPKGVGNWAGRSRLAECARAIARRSRVRSRWRPFMRSS